MRLIATIRIVAVANSTYIFKAAKQPKPALHQIEAAVANP